MTAGARSFMADTTALLIFFTCVGVLNERFIAGMPWQDVLTSRMIGAPLMVLTARPYGLWRDFVIGSTESPRARLVRDTLSLLSFQVPIYAGIIGAGGADIAQLLRGSAGAAVLMIVLGRPYGLWLDWVRGRFGLESGGMKPMSIGD